MENIQIFYYFKLFRYMIILPLSFLLMEMCIVCKVYKKYIDLQRVRMKFKEVLSIPLLEVQPNRNERFA